MLAAFIATWLFSISIVCASRSTRALGGVKANFIRISIATLLLGVWAHGFGGGFSGPARGFFFLSGCIGFGIGDMALYLALPTLGARLSMVLVHCLAAPCAAFVEWVWIGTKLDSIQAGSAAMILVGVAVALAPDKRVEAQGGPLVRGIALGVVAAVSQGIGAVISRKAFAVCRETGWEIDGGTAAYQRILGGLIVTSVGIALLRRWRAGAGQAKPAEKADLRRVWLWVLANSLAGPILGVSFFQLALKTGASGVVLPIIATTPIFVIPLAYWIEGDRPCERSLIGGAVAVAGAVLLAMTH